MDVDDLHRQPPIFIVGCSRSGTGLLRNLLRSHPHLAIPGESHFIPRLFQAYGDPRTDREARRLAEIILGLYWVKRWNVLLTPSLLSSCRNYATIVARIFAEYARQQGKQRWGDKTPDYVTEIPTLLHLFPNAKILHIIRDGRDVALSWMRIRNGPRNLFTAATYWKARVSAGRNAGATLAPNTYLEVRYEALLGDARETMRGVCNFICEPFVEAVLAPTRRSHDPLPTVIGTRAPHVHAPEILSDNREKWKREMSRSDQVLFGSVAGDLLQILGYETEHLFRRITAIEQLGWRAHHRGLNVLDRLNTKHKRAWLPSSLRIWWAGVRPVAR